MKTIFRAVLGGVAMIAVLAGCPSSENPSDAGDAHVAADSQPPLDAPGDVVVPTDSQPPLDAPGDVVVLPDSQPPQDVVLSDASHRVPRVHRADDSACTAARPAGACTFSGGPPTACTTDSQCTTGTNGRCTEGGGGGIAICQCSYDTCANDVACPTGQTCACHGSEFEFGGNTCVPGNCRVDADCGAGNYCSPSVAPSSCGSLGGYYCHGASDECTDDTDCGTTGGAPQICDYSTAAGHWVCAPELFCA